MTNGTRITIAGAHAFAAAEGRDAVLWDSIAPGVGLRMRANARKTWIVHRRCNGSVVKRTLGTLDALTVAPAFLADCAESPRRGAHTRTVCACIYCPRLAIVASMLLR